jgi:hypothetical protein
LPQFVTIEPEIPGDQARFRTPPDVQAWPQALLNRQDQGVSLIKPEREEAEGLVDLAELLSLICLRAERASGRAVG